MLQIKIYSRAQRTLIFDYILRESGNPERISPLFLQGRSGWSVPLHPLPQTVVQLAPTVKPVHVRIMVEQVCIWQEGHRQGGWGPNITFRQWEGRTAPSSVTEEKMHAKHTKACYNSFSSLHDYNYLSHWTDTAGKEEDQSSLWWPCC